MRGQRPPLTDKTVKKQTGKFKAQGDDGRDYTIHVYMDYVHAGTFDDPHAELEGLKELRTSEGEAVNYIEKGRYQIVASGVVIRATDSNAL